MKPSAARAPKSESAHSTFRDPAGRVFLWQDRVLRCVLSEGRRSLESALGSPTLRAMRETGNLTAVMELSAPEGKKLSATLLGLAAVEANPLWVEHPKVTFTSYPYEWAPEMLHAAASLTIDLALSLAEEGLGLKDANAYNILFEGPKPVFVDWLSFETRNPRDPRWLPYAQFAKHFINPLALHKHKGISPSDLLFRRRDGIDPVEAYALCNRWERWMFPFLTLFTLPTLLSAKTASNTSRVYSSFQGTEPEKAQFILKSVLKSLSHRVRALAPATGRASRWVSYLSMDGFQYNQEQFQFKENFVRETLVAANPKTVLDVGCNTGHFSFLAAETGARVVGIDSDESSIGLAWERARRANAHVLPLVVDISRPTPATGWKNTEAKSFLDRAGDSFEATLMLAVVHHMAITERIPFADIVLLASELTVDHLIVENILPSDPQFQSLTRGRDYSHLTESSFEQEFKKYFTIEKKSPIAGTSRILYHMRRKQC